MLTHIISRIQRENTRQGCFGLLTPRFLQNAFVPMQLTNSTLWNSNRFHQFYRKIMKQESIKLS